jgi:predicted Fe-Mo cluster-binding NifX family protein
MKLILIPIFGNRISPRLDFAQSLQLIKIENQKITSRETIKIITQNRLDRINKIINLKPDAIICDGLTEMCIHEFEKADIKVIPWVHGEIEKVLKLFLEDKLNYTIASKENSVK